MGKNLSDSNWTRTHNHLVHKETPNHLVKLDTINCGFTLKRVRDMIRKYSQMHWTDSQHSSIIWPVWLNGRVFVYELSGCGFESSCCHLNVRLCGYFEQGVPRHSGKYRLRIHSETSTWHDKNIQSTGKNIGKTWVVNTVKNFLIMQNNLRQIRLKLLLKQQFKKQ